MSIAPPRQRTEQQSRQGLGVLDAQPSRPHGRLERRHDGGEDVLLVELGEARQPEHGRCVDDDDPLDVGLQHGIEERLEAPGEELDLVRGPLGGAGRRFQQLEVGRFETASNSAALVGKWW